MKKVINKLTAKQKQKQELEELKQFCRKTNIPGPDVKEHDDLNEGPCFCLECLSYYGEG